MAMYMKSHSVSHYYLQGNKEKSDTIKKIRPIAFVFFPKYA